MLESWKSKRSSRGRPRAKNHRKQLLRPSQEKQREEVRLSAPKSLEQRLHRAGIQNSKEGGASASSCSSGLRVGSIRELGHRPLREGVLSAPYWYLMEEVGNCICQGKGLGCSSQVNWLYFSQNVGKFKPKGTFENNGDCGGKQLRRSWQFHENKLTTDQPEIYLITKESPYGVGTNLKDWPQRLPMRRAPKFIGSRWYSNLCPRALLKTGAINLQLVEAGIASW